MSLRKHFLKSWFSHIQIKKKHFLITEANDSPQVYSNKSLSFAANSAGNSNNCLIAVAIKKLKVGSDRSECLAYL